MKNQVKVQEITDFLDHQKKRAVAVCEGKLIFVTHFDLGEPDYVTYLKIPNWKPVIVSETEKIQDEDKVLYMQHDDKISVRGLSNGTILTVSKNRGLYLSTYEFTNIDIRADYCKKILAFPDNFSPKQLQAINDKKLRSGMNVLVECSVKLREEWRGSDRDGEPFTVEDYSIKLNPKKHIKLFPLVKDSSLSDKLFQLANEFAIAKQGDIAVKLHAIHNTL